MSDQEARYDRIAEGYAEWWSPVHRGASLALLDEIEGDVASGARRVLDVGCGTGALAAAAVTRWPGVELDGTDISAGMLRIAFREAERLPGQASDRLRFTQASADRLPFADATFDVAVSAFVLQLVPSRFAALREIRRVLRPGGRLAYVTWLRGGSRFAGDECYDAARREVGLAPLLDEDDVPAPADGEIDLYDPGNDDVPTPGHAVRQLRRAGFTGAMARAALIEHAFTPESYLGFVARFDDADEFSALDPARREALEHRLLERLRRLPAKDLVMRLPIVHASGTRSR